MIFGFPHFDYFDFLLSHLYLIMRNLLNPLNCEINYIILNESITEFN